MIKSRKNSKIGLDGIMVGGYTDKKLKSGITIFTVKRPNVAGIYQSGGSPASRETDILRSIHRPDYSIDAMVFTGRSVFGFDIVQTIMKKLSLNKIGVDLGQITVPLIPSLGIFDFYDNSFLPNKRWATEALKNLGKEIPLGSYWGGTGATVGKYEGIEKGKKSGQGYYEIRNGDLIIGVYVIANSIGYVYDLDGKNIVSKELEDLQNLYKSRERKIDEIFDKMIQGNTTIGAVLTNAILDNREANYIAQIANFGFSARIFPYSSGYDGDTVLCVSTLKIKSSLDKVAYLTRIAAEKAVLSIFTF